jgi:hypothetical protein
MNSFKKIFITKNKLSICNYLPEKLNKNRYSYFSFVKYFMYNFNIDEIDSSNYFILRNIMLFINQFISPNNSPFWLFNSLRVDRSLFFVQNSIY